MEQLKHILLIAATSLTLPVGSALAAQGDQNSQPSQTQQQTGQVGQQQASQTQQQTGQVGQQIGQQQGSQTQQQAGQTQQQPAQTQQQQPTQQQPTQQQPTQQQPTQQQPTQQQPTQTQQQTGQLSCDQLPYFLVLEVPFDSNGAQLAQGAKIEALSLPIPMMSDGCTIDGDQLLADVVAHENLTSSALPLSAYATGSQALPDIVSTLFSEADANTCGGSIAWHFWGQSGSCGIYGFNTSQLWGPYSQDGAVVAPTFGFYMNGAAYPFTYSFYRTHGNSYYYFYFD